MYPTPGIDTYGGQGGQGKRVTLDEEQGLSRNKCQEFMARTKPKFSWQEKSDLSTTVMSGRASGKGHRGLGLAASLELR